MRDAMLEKQAAQTLKQKQRERVQSKMGKMDIDYQQLNDAFFKHQTKPELTRFGEVYSFKEGNSFQVVREENVEDKVSCSNDAIGWSRA